MVRGRDISNNNDDLLSAADFLLDQLTDFLSLPVPLRSATAGRLRVLCGSVVQTRSSLHVSH